MDWLPDLKVGTIEIRDLVSLVVGGLGVFLAYLAIKLGKEQAKIAEKQTGIAEKQDRIMQEQLDKRTELSIALINPQAHGEGHRYDVAVLNEGSRSAMTGLYWHLYLPAGREGGEWNAAIEANHSRVVTAIDVVDQAHFKGFLQSPIFPTRHVSMGTVIFTNVASPLLIRWSIIAEDGKFPRVQEYGTITFNPLPVDD